MKILAAYAFLIIMVFVIIPLPSWIAIFRKHPYRKPIFVLNIALVWTGIGWIALIVWAFTGNKSEIIDRALNRFNIK